MFEPETETILSPHLFAKRMLRFCAAAGLMISLALLVGVTGYHHFAGFGWVDAFLNSSMILSGMGPVGELRTTAAKLFASFYALFSGIVFIAVMGTLFAPVLHRIMHTFHVDGKGR